MSLVKRVSLSGDITLDQVWPIGSIYITMNDINPANLFGGRWDRITGRFLLAATDGGATGDNIQKNANVDIRGMGGEAAHTLGTGEIPGHTHPYEYKGDAAAALSGSNPSDMGSVVRRKNPTAASGLTTGQNSGGGGSHNNMPPFIAVYVWERKG